MAAWKRGQRHESWASNGNVAVYIFMLLFIVWVAFQIWARLPGGPPPPTGLDPMVMAALGVAVTTKSVEKRAAEDDLKDKIKALEDVAKEVKPEEVAKRSPPLEST